MSLDLFTPVIPHERFHPAFATLFADAKDADKKVFADWSEGFIDRDNKFVNEFQTTFDSSFWELYLHAVFKELEMKCDFQWDRPDFCISSPIPFIVEATVALNARGTASVAETDPLEMPKDFNEFNRQAIIRLSNSIHTKYKKYCGAYSTLSHVSGKPFVLAISAFDRPHFYLQAQRAIEAVLYRAYVDEDTYLKKHPSRDVPLKPEDLPFVAKDSGEKLPLGLFCDASMAGISAVIHSTASTWSKVLAMGSDPDVMIEAIYEDRVQGGQNVYIGPNGRYTESILDGLRVYHNPHAINPLDPSLFDRPEIFQATSTGPVKLEMLSTGRHILVNRKATRFPVGTMKVVLDEMPPDKSFWHHV